MKKYLLIIFSLLLLAGGTFTILYFLKGGTKEIVSETRPLQIWYTDETMADYLNDAAVVYEEKYGVKVNTKQVPALEYMELIQEETLHGNNGPDVFLVENDSLEKAALSGLGMETKDPKNYLNSANFPNVALHAATYDGKIMGYPLSYNTAVFLYNDTYLKQIAKTDLTREQIASEAEETVNSENSSESTSETDVSTVIPEFTEDEIAFRAEEILPVSLVGILEFANKYDAPEGSEEFFKWNVCDVLYNYMFAGAYMDLGGECGDNPEEINLYNENAIYGLSLFQDFNQFFSIESKEIDYSGVIQEFKEGKLVFTMANADIISELEMAKADGSFTYEYGIVPIGMMNAIYNAKGLSVTQVAVVNAYGSRCDEAENLAGFLACEYSENLYSRSGKMSAFKLKEVPVPQMEQVFATYENTNPIPKIVESSNYWLLVERLYTDCWNGADVNAKLRELSCQIKYQVQGNAEEEPEIPTPELDESYIEEE